LFLADSHDTIGIIYNQVYQPDIFEARGVSNDIPQRDWRVERFSNLEGFKIRIDVRVQVELSLLDQLHYRHPGEELRNRPGAEQRLRGIDGNPGLDVLVAVSLLKNQLAPQGDSDSTGRAAVCLHHWPYQAVHKRLQGGPVIH